jgi:signal transduction histidine kinase
MSDSDREHVDALTQLPAWSLPGGRTLRMANLAVRGLLLALVAALVFTAPRPGRVEGGLEVFAFVAGAALLVLQVPVDRAAAVGRRPGGVLPWAIAAIAVLSGAASAVPTGGPFVLLATTSMVSAGSEVGLVAGLAILGSGIAVTEGAGLALGAGTSTTIEYPILLLLGFVLGRNVRAHRLRAQHSERLREKQATLATLDERARIAREIHDVLAHSLGALSVQIQAARAVLTDTHDEARVVALLDHAHRLTTDGLQETRLAVQALRGDTVPLPEGLARLCEEHRLRHGTVVEVAVTGEPQRLSPDASVALTRTAQEALVNTAKHAPHQPVSMSLRYGTDGTSLVVRSPLAAPGHGGAGAGFSTVDGQYGLAGMRERLLLLGGVLTAGQRGTDWVVSARVPR